MYYNALNSYFKALKYYTAADNITRRYLTMTNIAMIFEKGHFLTKSLNLYDDARELALAENDSLTLAKIDYHRARINRLSKNYSEAEALYQQAVAQFERLGSNYMINETHAELGLLHEQQDNIEKAVKYYSMPVLSDNEGQVDIYAKVRQLNNLAYGMLNQYLAPDSAQRLLLDALALSQDQEEGLHYLKAKIYGNLAKGYEIEERLDSAIILFEKSLQYLNPKNYSIEYLHTTKLIADYYDRREPEKARHYQERIYSFADELATMQNQMEHSYIKYQVEAAKFKQESEERYIAQLEQRFLNRILYVVILFLLILIMTTLYIRRKRKHKKARATLILKKQGAI